VHSCLRHSTRSSCRIRHDECKWSRRELDILEVYEAEGWRGSNRDKLKPRAEMQRAEEQVAASYCPACCCSACNGDRLLLQIWKTVCTYNHWPEGDAFAFHRNRISNGRWREGGCFVFHRNRFTMGRWREGDGFAFQLYRFSIGRACRSG
jgi:hypothetical protein